MLRDDAFLSACFVEQGHLGVWADFFMPFVSSNMILFVRFVWSVLSKDREGWSKIG